MYFHAPEDVPFINSDPELRKEILLGEALNISINVRKIQLLKIQLPILGTFSVDRLFNVKFSSKSLCSGFNSPCNRFSEIKTDQSTI